MRLVRHRPTDRPMHDVTRDTTWTEEGREGRNRCVGVGGKCHVVVSCRHVVSRQTHNLLCYIDDILYICTYHHTITRIIEYKYTRVFTTVCRL